MKPNKGPWFVVPIYAKENEYRLWDNNGNYHKDRGLKRIQANAKLMAHAPAFLTALESIANNTCCEGCQEAARVAQLALKAYKSYKLPT